MLPISLYCVAGHVCADIRPYIGSGRLFKFHQDGQTTLIFVPVLPFGVPYAMDRKPTETQKEPRSSDQEGTLSESGSMIPLVPQRPLEP